MTLFGRCLALSKRMLFACDAAPEQHEHLCRIDREHLEKQVEDLTHQLARMSRQHDRILSLTVHDLRDHLASLSFLAAAPNSPPVIVNLHQQGVQILEALEAHRRQTAAWSSGPTAGSGTDRPPRDAPGAGSE
jgi:hypothetical protein